MDDSARIFHGQASVDGAPKAVYHFPLRGHMPTCTFTFTYTYAYRFFIGGGLVEVRGTLS